jgi:hypothetical protein
VVAQLTLSLRRLSRTVKDRRQERVQRWQSRLQSTRRRETNASTINNAELLPAAGSSCLRNRSLKQERQERNRLLECHLTVKVTERVVKEANAQRCVPVIQ